MEMRNAAASIDGDLYDFAEPTPLQAILPSSRSHRVQYERF
jgi:hypothetical protein